MRKLFHIDPDLCTGCRICEMACSFRRTGAFGPYKSAIWILKREQRAIDIPVVCRQCRTPPCEQACPAERVYGTSPSFQKPIVQDVATGAITISMEKFCFGCNECLNACPFVAIRLDPEGMELVVCDLCKGDPECIKWCPTQAIRFVPVSAITTMKAVTANKRTIEKGQAR